MGTFAGHIVPGLALTLLGLWHTINTISAFCNKGCANFTVKFWYPFYGPLSRLKHLELIFILSFSVFAIFMQLLDFPFPRFSFKLDSFEHASMFLHLAIFAGFTLSAEISQSSDILSALAATSFPKSFPAALVLSISVVFQGCWFMNMGFMLWFPDFVPEGCVMKSAEASIDDMHAAGAKNLVKPSEIDIV
ncbi:PROTEINASE INHIBITOR I4 SERPIN (DUF716)-RELATED [Salix purpurea]|uniref:PROTEINASE INHIBITOR I4 SERPIN (DUF716)-RELATED n=1 Tax=Salix purpurea TaxID=77065 RepID=A0A9Q0PQF6_SALPP|nr:PROTEINASE INHIBITOR I4 SERPIN (DUF716)-RELATED [Salix purpurea]